MSSNHELMEAVNKYNKLEAEFHAHRIIVASLLQKASETQQVTQLARLTKINRTTIYWLINTWSESNNGNGNSGHHGSKG